MEEGQSNLKKDLLRIKMKMLKVLSNPQKFNQTKRKKSVSIDSEGGFDLSDDEVKPKIAVSEEASKPEEDIKSVSTDVTIENVNLLIFDSNSVGFE